MDHLFPAFLKLTGRKVLVVGGGPVAAAKIAAIRPTGARLVVVAPDVSDAVREAGVEIRRRRFRTSDLAVAWFVVTAAPKDVNRRVARAAEKLRIFVNAVDDPSQATAYLGGVLRRSDVTVAISTAGRAPALAGLLREGFDALLPADLDTWFERADALKAEWRSTGVPMEARRPALVDALLRLYDGRTPATAASGHEARR
jgi:uroporphyrin-III C-methyltransferase/precorrin-2 dehydrogenase/sirohydrochlorin ferrochelatase